MIVREVFICFFIVAVKFEISNPQIWGHIIYHGNRQIYNHCLRNQDPIRLTLENHIFNFSRKELLEIGAGSGQHANHFSQYFPLMNYQPTDLNDTFFKSIDDWCGEIPNVQPAKFLDVRMPASQWLNGTIKKNSIDYIYCATMLHDNEFECTKGLFAGSGEVLRPGGLLFIYGPFAYNGTIKPEFLVDFNLALKDYTTVWGLRDIILEMEPLAHKAGLRLIENHRMPESIRLLVYEKDKNYTAYTLDSP